MKVVRFIPVVAIAFALVASFAFKAPRFVNFYGVAGINANGWVVAEEINGEVENVDYECPEETVIPCSVSASGVYTPGQTIPFASAVIIIDDREFVDLDPTE